MACRIRPLPPALRPIARAAASPCHACAIRDLSLCAALQGEDEIAALERIRSDIRLGEDETVFFEADPARHLFIIVEGCLKLYKLLADGRRQITGFLFPSDFLGLAHQDRYAYSAEAVTPVVLCRFDRSKLEALMEHFPKLEKRLLGIASNELAAAQDQILLLGRKTADERVASFIHVLTRRAFLRDRDATTVPLPMSRGDIADHLGLTTETVSRCFTRLKKRGVIRFDDAHEVTIADRDAFDDLAGIDDAEADSAA